MLLSAPRSVRGQNPDQIGADRHQPRFVELALANAENPGVKIDIGQGQGKRFADPQPGAIQQEQKRSIGVRINTAARMIADRDGIE